MADQSSNDWTSGDDIGSRWNSPTETSEYGYSSEDLAKYSTQSSGDQVDVEDLIETTPEAQPDGTFDHLNVGNWADDWKWTPQTQEIEWNSNGSNVIDDRGSAYWYGPTPEEIAEQERQLVEWEQQAPARRAAWEDEKRQRAPHKMVDEPSLVTELLSLLEECTEEPKVVVDVEGFNDYRQECDIMEIYMHDFDQLYLLDFYTMGEEILEITTRTGFSLRQYLSSAKYPKIFWDVRQDANALFMSYGIKLAGVLDASLMLPRLKMRHDRYETHRISAEVAIEEILVKKNLICPEEYEDLTDGKRERTRLPFEAWTIRPLPPALLEYVCDVRLMGMMYHQYLAPAYERLPDLLQWVQYGTEREIDYACSPFYSRTSRFGACTPWSPEGSVPDNWLSSFENPDFEFLVEKMSSSIQQRRAQKHIKDPKQYEFLTSAGATNAAIETSLPEGECKLEQD